MISHDSEMTVSISVGKSRVIVSMEKDMQVIITVALLTQKNGTMAQ